MAATRWYGGTQNRRHGLQAPRRHSDYDYRYICTIRSNMSPTPDRRVVWSLAEQLRAVGIAPPPSPALQLTRPTSLPPSLLLRKLIRPSRLSEASVQKPNFGIRTIRQETILRFPPETATVLTGP